MTQKRISKQYKDTFKVSERRGSATHGTRQRAPEYLSRKRRNVMILESFCGRKHELDVDQPHLGVTKGKVDCRSCIKAMAAK